VSHDDLVEQAKEAINKVFGDMSGSRSRNRESLKDLRDEIDILLDMLWMNKLY
jgi:hypothetical protein